MTISPPSRNPTTNNTLPGVLDVVLSKFLQGVDDMLPAQVVAFNRATNTATVQPLIFLVTTSGVSIRRALCANVPVVRMGGNGVVTSYNLVAGDMGWIKANDRDISLLKRTWKETTPNTGRKHSFEDAIFIPDMQKNVTINASYLANAVTQTADGSSGVAYMTGNNIMECFSTTKAFQFPRMTRAQRDAIPSPRGGMMVYVTDAPAGFSGYTDGIGWS